MIGGSAAFRHEALLYADAEGFLAGTVPFVESGLAAGEPVLVALPGHDEDRLRDALGRAADRVDFLDMEAVGRNPARIIPAWQDFVERHVRPGRPARGIGEPAWPGRSADELVECDLHERLLNVAFDSGPAWSLLCPYDVAGLDQAVVSAAQRNHPVVIGLDGPGPSHAFAYDGQLSEDDLPRAPSDAECLSFDHNSLGLVRRTIDEAGQDAGLKSDRLDDYVLAVNEIATNSVRYGGGSGVLRWWDDASALICEISDSGWIHDPLAGRVRPPLDQPNGRGLWMANQLCDLLQLRSSPRGTVIRMQVAA